MSVKMRSTLPHGEHNGLAAELPDLIRNPKKKRVIIAVVDVKSIVDEVESGDRTPQVQIRRAEFIGEDDLAMAHRLLQRAWEARSGDEMLPMEMEDELSELFEGVDLTAVEDDEIPGDAEPTAEQAERDAATGAMSEAEAVAANEARGTDVEGYEALESTETVEVQDVPDEYATPDDPPEDAIPAGDDLFKS